MLRVESSNRCESNPFDFYATPSRVVRACLDILANPPAFAINPGRVLDPGCGGGAWGRGVKDRWPNAEIVGVEADTNVLALSDVYDQFIYADFRSVELEGLFDLVIGNPPYTVTYGARDLRLAQRFVERGWSLLNEHGVMAYLLRLNFLEGLGRANDLFASIPPAVVYQSISRIPWNPEKYGQRSNAVAYGFFIWVKGFERQDVILRWFDWRGEVTRVLEKGSWKTLNP